MPFAYRKGELEAVAIDPDPTNPRYKLVEYQFKLSDGTVHTLTLPIDSGIGYDVSTPVDSLSVGSPSVDPLSVGSFPINSLPLDNVLEGAFGDTDDEAFDIFTHDSGSHLTLGHSGPSGDISFALDDEFQLDVPQAYQESQLPDHLSDIAVPDVGDVQLTELSEDDEQIEIVPWSYETEASLRHEEHNIFTTEQEDTAFALHDEAEPLELVTYTPPTETSATNDTLRASRQLPFTVVDKSERIRPFITSSGSPTQAPSPYQPAVPVVDHGLPFSAPDKPILNEIHRPKIAPTIAQAQSTVANDPIDPEVTPGEDEDLGPRKSAIDWKSLALFGGIGVLLIGGVGYYMLGGGGSSSTSTASSSSQSSSQTTQAHTASSPTTQVVHTTTAQSLTAFCSAARLYPSLSLNASTTPTQAQSEFTQATTAIASMLKTTPPALQATLASMQSNVGTLSNLLQANHWVYSTLPTSDSSTIVAASNALNTDAQVLDTTLAKC